MNNLNHLFNGFSALFDKNISEEERSRLKASMKVKIEANMHLINHVADSGKTTTETTTIYL